MPSNRKLSDEEYREKIRRARSMTPEQRVLEGCRLTDLAFDSMKAEIRADFPQAPESEVQRILDLRIAVMRIAKGKVPEAYRHLLEQTHRPAQQTSL